MTPRLLLGTALVAALCACGDDARDAVPGARDTEPEAIAVPRSEAEDRSQARITRATVTDLLGTFEGEVYGLAVWEHPALSFASAVIAANGDAGLAVIPVDDEVETATLSGTFDGPVAVGYAGEDSYVAAASGGEVRLFTLSEARDFAPIGTLDADPGALCMAEDTLLVVAAEATAYRIGPEGAGAALFSVPATDATRCAATRDRFYLAAPDAPVRAFGRDGATADLGGAYTAGGEGGLAVVQTADGAALLTLAQGALTVDGPDAALGEVAVETGDGPLGRADLIAAGSGNFGSVYRDGVVALLAENELMLLPWAGVARAAGTARVETLSLRPEVPFTPEPEIRVELPEIDGLGAE